MNSTKNKTNVEDDLSTTEVLLLPDGQVYVHNLTPAFAELLKELNPTDEQIQPRATTSNQQDSQ